MPKKLQWPGQQSLAASFGRSVGWLGEVVSNGGVAVQGSQVSLNEQHISSGSFLQLSLCERNSLRIRVGIVVVEMSSDPTTAPINQISANRKEKICDQRDNGGLRKPSS